MSGESNTNPDLNGLYDPDGNAFTDAFIEHLEKQQEEEIPMLFSESHPGELNRFLTNQSEQGYKWAAYIDGLHELSTEDLHCFKSVYDVQEFCYENSTDHDHFSFKPIETLKQNLETWLKTGNDKIDIEKLEKQMKNADWHFEYSDDFRVWEKGSNEIKEIKQGLLLVSKQERGIDKASDLWDKYVPENSVSKPDFLKIKSKAMTEKELTFVQNQFKKLGVADAFTPALAEQMKKGEPNIQHTFNKSYDGDEAKAVFHLKKSESSDMYFLNKFDMSVQKEGQADSINRTFYVNNFKPQANNENQNPDRYYTNFTFKSAYNYLSGRPVLNNYQNQKGENYQSWDVMNPRKILDNGKFDEKNYHQNYGFNLDKVLNNFSIAERTNPAYFESLKSSLQRGNLQLATFIGQDNKREKLYVSPNIPLGTLNVYDQHRQRIPTQNLVEKGYIGKEFAESLTQRMENAKQKNQPTVSGETKEKQTQKTEEEKPGETVKKEVKQTQNQKTGKLKNKDDTQKPGKRQKVKIK